MMVGTGAALLDHETETRWDDCEVTIPREVEPAVALQGTAAKPVWGPSNAREITSASFKLSYILIFVTAPSYPNQQFL